VLAGKYGLGVLQLAVAIGVRGAVDLREQWRIGEQAAAEHGQTLDRAQWSLCIPVHLAETRQQALDEARAGAGAYQLDYFETTLGRKRPVEGPHEKVIDQMTASGSWLVGTPDDCIAGIRRFQEATGGFGSLMILAHEWAPREATLRSYELFARYVAPQFQGTLAGTTRSAAWAAQHAGEFRARADAAIETAHQAYERRQAASPGTS
jgi:limonene 1,2-monooxygenase